MDWGKLAPHVGRGLDVIVHEDTLDEITVRAIGKVGGAPLGHAATAILGLGKLLAARSLRALRVLDNTLKRLPGNGAWHPDHTLTKTLEALTKALPSWPHLRELGFDDYDVDLDLHDLALAEAFWAAAANVEHLTIRTNRFLSTHHPSLVRWPPGLRSLRIEAQQHHRLVFEHLAAPLPELRALDVWLPALTMLESSSRTNASEHASDPDPVATWLAVAHERFPRLEHLGLLLCDDPRLLALVANAPIAKTLRSLSLAGGRVVAADLAELAARTKLEHLDLSECALDDDAVAAARAIVPGALVHQRAPDVPRADHAPPSSARGRGELVSPPPPPRPCRRSPLGVAPPRPSSAGRAGDCVTRLHAPIHATLAAPRSPSPRRIRLRVCGSALWPRAWRGSLRRQPAAALAPREPVAVECVGCTGRSLRWRRRTISRPAMRHGSRRSRGSSGRSCAPISRSPQESSI